MTPLITVNGHDWPEPSTYSGLTATLVDSARNINGYTVGSVIRHDVAKVEVSWKYLTASQWASILSDFTRNFYCTVRFFNQATADYETRTMYVSDRTAGMWRRHPDDGAVMGWTNCSLSLVER